MVANGQIALGKETDEVTVFPGLLQVSASFDIDTTTTF
jgi:hypothetical protein